MVHNEGELVIIDVDKINKPVADALEQKSGACEIAHHQANPLAALPPNSLGEYETDHSQRSNLGYN